MRKLPKYAFKAYALLYNRFGESKFDQSYLAWFMTEPMRKKVFHLLTKSGWLKRIGRGEYACVHPEKILFKLFEFKVPSLLEKVKLNYCYARMSAVEIWCDYNYLQRSWECSPYFIKVLKKDLKKWVNFFKGNEIEVFIKEPKPTIGEFVVLLPVKKIDRTIVNNKPVEKLKDVVKFCEKNLETFEYPLAYLVRKYKVRTKVKIDPKVLRGLL